MVFKAYVFNLYMEKRIILSLMLGLSVFVFVAVFLRCFPLGCTFFDWKELGKIFIYIVIPVFVITYLLTGLLKKWKK
jgi:hypothetical protein